MVQQQPSSMFEVLTYAHDPNVTPITATKTTLIHLSHVLEDLVLTERLPSLICTGFQSITCWEQERERYEDLATVAAPICIFSSGSLPYETNPAFVHVPLDNAYEPLKEWFVVVLSERFEALLCARELPSTTFADHDRRFALIWSLEQSVIKTALSLLQEIIARFRPERMTEFTTALQRYTSTSVDQHLYTLLTHHLIDQLEQQQQTRLQLERAIADEARLFSLGQTLASVAHELNNPIQSILGFASLSLHEPDLSPGHRENVEFILEAAERARNIVHNLLHLARAPEQLFTTVSLAELIDKTIVFVRAELDAANIQLAVEVAPDVPPVQGDMMRLQQLLINLLTNACQALGNQPGKRKVTVRLTHSEPLYVALTIEDNGPGIPSSLQKHIWEPFFTTKPLGQGTGLGLSIVKAIVAEHQGLLNVHSTPQGGTCFVISLPAATNRSEVVRSV